MEKQLPKNWVLLPFTEIFDINGGTQPPKAVFIDEPKEGYIRLLQIRDFGKKPVPTYIPDTGKLMTCKKDDILIARYGASIGRIVTGMEGSYNVALAKVGVPENMNKNFVKWLLKSNLFQEPILSIQRTAQNGFNKTDLAAIYVPLPPLPEQQRIVAKLDTLFAQLETIKTSMANIPLLLKDFRQQVLTQAVTGKLTEEWKKGKKLKIWENIELNKVIPKGGIFDGPFGSNLKTEDYIDQGVRVIRLENIEHLDFIENKETYVSDEKHQKLIRHTVSEGDIIFSSFISEDIRACILPKLKTKAIAKADCFCIRPDETIIDKKFLLYILVSNVTYTQLTSHIHGATRPRINTTQLKTITIPLVPLKEQKEIVSRVESLFAKADAIEQQYKNLKASIDTLPQAFLHKAFKGELSEQLDSDGDARDLLEQIKRLKAITEENKKKKVKV
jgi:type I restriction enzyme S subunit